jgi:hypothetical protein
MEVAIMLRKIALCLAVVFLFASIAPAAIYVIPGTPHHYHAAPQYYEYSGSVTVDPGVTYATPPAVSWQVGPIYGNVGTLAPNGAVVPRGGFVRGPLGRVWMVRPSIAPVAPTMYRHWSWW